MLQLKKFSLILFTVNEIFKPDCVVHPLRILFLMIIRNSITVRVGSFRVFLLKDTEVLLCMSYFISIVRSSCFLR